MRRWIPLLIVLKIAKSEKIIKIRKDYVNRKELISVTTTDLTLFNLFENIFERSFNLLNHKHDFGFGMNLNYTQLKSAFEFFLIRPTNNRVMIDIKYIEFLYRTVSINHNHNKPKTESRNKNKI